MKYKFTFLIILLFFSAFSWSQTSFFSATNGPYFEGGDVRYLTMNQNGDLFACVWNRGLFRSTDNGDNWIRINNGIMDNRFIWFLLSRMDIFMQQQMGMEYINLRTMEIHGFN